MRVLFITNAINRGGVAKVVLGYAIGLCKSYEDFSCDIVSFEEPKEEISKELDKYNIGVFVTEPVSTSFRRFKKCLENIMRNKKYDVVHSHIEYFNWIPCSIAKRFGIRIRVGHAHGQKGNSPSLIHKIVEAIGRRLNRLYCNCRFACSEPSGKFVFGHGFTFLPNYVDDIDKAGSICADEEKITKKYNNEFDFEKGKHFILGYMGYLGFEKNPFLAIKSVENLCKKNPNIKLLLVGDGAEKENISNYLLKQQCNDCIRLLGHRSDNLQLMKYFDILLMPSFSEGMSLALLEAQLMGTTCVVSSGVPDTNDLGFGLYVKSKNMTVESFSESISIALENNKTTSTSFEQRNQLLVQKRYDKLSVLKTIMEVYEGGNC